MTRLPADYLADAEKRARRFMGQWCGTSGSLAADVIRVLKDRNAILQELDAMTQQLADANARLRDAIAARRKAIADGKPAERWYDEVGGCCDGGKCHTQATDAQGFHMQAIDEQGPLVDVDQVIAEDDARTPEADMAIDADYILRGQRELETAPDDIRWTGDSIHAQPADGLRPGSREFLDVLEELKRLHLAKTLDYGVDEDALSNIRQSADVVNMPAWAGCVIRMSDKMHRLKAFFRRGKVEFDGIEDTLKDLACYAAIALVLYREASHPVRVTT